MQLNPFGTIPVLQDGSFVLSESMAITSYLANKGGGDFKPQGAYEEAQCQQWSLWVMTSCEKAALSLLFASMRKQDAPSDAVEELSKALAGFEKALSGKQYLIGDRFTVADLNVASVLKWAHIAKFDFGPFPVVASWLKLCTQRPAAKL